MKKFLLLAGCGLILCGVNAVAQEVDKCGTIEFKHWLMQKNPAAAAALQQHEEGLADRVIAYKASRQNAQLKTTDQSTIPVIFHIVLSATKLTQMGGPSGIQDRVNSQMAVINEDFNRGNADSTTIPAPFKPFYGNVGIKFGLANKAPDGSPSPGYEIITTTAETFDVFSGDAKHVVTGGADHWDEHQYINVWVIAPSNAGILGFSLAPNYVNLGFQADEIGVVINYKAFGRRTSPFQLFVTGIDKGRTLTHELGHFFDLRHIWGDDNGMCPSSGGTDDGISDTPPQGGETTSNDNPIFPAADACAPIATGKMFMNYMDYSDDRYLTMFTNEQILAMNGFLNSDVDAFPLTQNPGLTGIGNIEKQVGMNVAPNPSSGPVLVSFGNPKGLQGINVINMTGQTVYSISTNDHPIENYNIDLSGFSKGLYLIQCNFAAGTVTRKIIVQ